MAVEREVTMSLSAISGTVTAVGQTVFTNDLTIFAYLEITETSGRRVSIEKVAVCNDVAARLELGATGEFFVDRIFRFSQSFRCQMFGIKAGGVAVLDRRDLRKRAIVAQLILGLALTPVLGIGLVLVVPNLVKALTLFTLDRRATFYGPDPVDGQRLDQTVRI
jgi:phosphotransferase system  glucose/maltose/N-acetylglucosamine-specific IIC component